MGDPDTMEIISLQQKLLARLEVMDIAERNRHHLARQLSHIAVLGRGFADRALPLLLSIEPDHNDLLKQVLISMKMDLDEMRDAVQDLEPEISEIIARLSANE